LAPKNLDEGQYHLTNDNGVFAGLNVEVGDARRAMVDEQFRQLIEPGAVAGQIAVVAPHAAIGAVFPAEIGDLDHAAQEDLAPEFFGGGAGGALVEGELGLATRFQNVDRWEKRLVNHRLS